MGRNPSESLETRIILHGICNNAIEIRGPNLEINRNLRKKHFYTQTSIKFILKHL